MQGRRFDALYPWLFVAMVLTPLCHEVGASDDASPVDRDGLPAIAADNLLQATLARFDQALRLPEPARALTIFADVAATTGESTAHLRSHLRQRLEQLDRLRQQGGDAWEALVTLGDPLSRSQVERAIDHLLRGLRDILDSDDDYLLDTSLRWAARGARVPAEQLLPFVGRLVSSQLVDDPLTLRTQPVGVVVNGWTERYEFKLEPILLYLDTEDEDEAREAVRDIQRFIVPQLVRRLKITPGVAWALRFRDLTVLVDPEYDVRLRVQSLRFTGATTNLHPCIDIGLRVVDLASEQHVLDIDIEHCTQVYGANSSRQLEGFFDEVADVIGEQLDPVFARFR